MDTGFDGPQIAALRKTFTKAVHEPAQLRLLVAGLIGAVGIFVLCRPEAQRLDEARAKCAQLEATCEDAEELRRLTAQSDTYLARLPKADDPSDWQQYVTKHLEAAGVKLRKIEPRKMLQSSTFHVMVMEVTADGMFPQLIDFLDRLERGERVVRFDRIGFEKRAATIGLRFQFFGLVKNRA